MGHFLFQRFASYFNGSYFNGPYFNGLCLISTVLISTVRDDLKDRIRKAIIWYTLYAKCDHPYFNGSPWGASYFNGSRLISTVLISTVLISTVWGLFQRFFFELFLFQRFRKLFNAKHDLRPYPRSHFIKLNWIGRELSQSGRFFPVLPDGPLWRTDGCQESRVSLAYYVSY